MLICWTLVVLVNAVYGRGYSGWTHVVQCTTLCMIVFMGVVYSSLKREAFGAVVFWTMLSLGIGAALSLSTIVSDVGVAKRLMVENVDPLLQSESVALGVGDYNLYTANAIAFPGSACNFLPQHRGQATPPTHVLRIYWSGNRVFDVCRRGGHLRARRSNARPIVFRDVDEEHPKWTTECGAADNRSGRVALDGRHRKASSVVVEKLERLLVGVRTSA